MVRTYKAPSAAFSYLTSIIAPLIVAGVLEISWPFFLPSPLSPFLIAAMISARYGGLGPGLVALVTSFLLANYFFVPPYFSLGPPQQTDAVYLIVFVTVGLAISFLSQSMRRATKRAEASRDSSRRTENLYRSLAAATSQVVWNTDDQGNISIKPYPSSPVRNEETLRNE